jgi:hypothetical protein
MTEIPIDYPESVHYPEMVFIIRLHDTNKAITLVDDELRLCEGFSARAGFHWQCVEKDIWPGLLNSVSGTMIGHNSRKKFITKAEKHLEFELFTPRPHPQGGYELLARHGQELWSMTVAEDGTELIETKGEGSLWDFLKVPDY